MHRDIKARSSTSLNVDLPPTLNITKLAVVSMFSDKTEEQKAEHMRMLVEINDSQVKNQLATLAGYMEVKRQEVIHMAEMSRMKSQHQNEVALIDQAAKHKSELDAIKSEHSALIAEIKLAAQRTKDEAKALNIATKLADEAGEAGRDVTYRYTLF